MGVSDSSRDGKKVGVGMNKVCEYCGCHTGGHLPSCVRPIHITVTDYAVQMSEPEKVNPDYVRELQRKLEIAHEYLDEIAFYGLSRPRELGEGDDGDGHYRRIAQNLIAIAANGRRKLR
jgi:hypothetical protein